jgi:homospermidine synthase
MAIARSLEEIITCKDWRPRSLDKPIHNSEDTCEQPGALARYRSWIPDLTLRGLARNDDEPIALTPQD